MQWTLISVWSMKSFLPATIIAHSDTILLTNCLQPYCFIWEVSKSRQSGWRIKHLCMHGYSFPCPVAWNSRNVHANLLKYYLGQVQKSRMFCLSILLWMTMSFHCELGYLKGDKMNSTFVPETKILQVPKGHVQILIWGDETINKLDSYTVDLYNAAWMKTYKALIVTWRLTIKALVVTCPSSLSAFRCPCRREKPIGLWELGCILFIKCDYQLHQ